MHMHPSPPPPPPPLTHPPIITRATNTDQPLPSPLCTACSLPTPASRGQQPAHLEADVALLAAQAGDHEEDEGEEAGEGDGHHCQR